MKLFFTEHFQNIFLKILKKAIWSSQHACPSFSKYYNAYAVFYCHKIPATRAYMVPLVGRDGTKAKAVAVCHTNTMEWNPKYLAFQQLKVKPGTAPICHFLPKDHIVWVVSK
ncbi:hypothetical protein PVL29_004235 [Vitis rotundifolia]|uniref:BURP domain-containing protein n=1 Tax=Vitis rotundifolia TaxID=103349 RepID=A0AA39E0R1_VITRO|nr:hypothetical protein PVL29_004235 [Vitis rotundifolia]